MLHAILIIMHADLKKTAPVVCKGAVTTTKTKDRKIIQPEKERQYWKRDNSQIDILLPSNCSHAVPFCDRV